MTTAYYISPSQKSDLYWFCDGVSNSNFSDSSLFALKTFLNTNPTVEINGDDGELVGMNLADQRFRKFINLYTDVDNESIYVELK